VKIHPRVRAVGAPSKGGKESEKKRKPGTRRAPAAKPAPGTVGPAAPRSAVKFNLTVPAAGGPPPPARKRRDSSANYLESLEVDRKTLPWWRTVRLTLLRPPRRSPPLVLAIPAARPPPAAAGKPPRPARSAACSPGRDLPGAGGGGRARRLRAARRCRSSLLLQLLALGPARRRPRAHPAKGEEARPAPPTVLRSST